MYIDVVVFRFQIGQPGAELRKEKNDLVSSLLQCVVTLSHKSVNNNIVIVGFRILESRNLP